MERKVFLRNAVGLFSAATLLDACKKDDDQTTNNNNTGGCIASPTEVEGPYPYVGGEITNPLNRVDITEGQTGVPFSLTLKVVNSNNNCSVVENARVDIWYCNKDGYYSGYGNQTGGALGGTQSYVGETWLRGYQLTDATGQVQFTCIYPGWYQGRATHIHFEVFMNTDLKKTGQIAFNEAVSDVVHVSSLYAAHGINTTRNSADGIFNNSSTDLANETVTPTGDTATGYAATYTIGVPL